MKTLLAARGEKKRKEEVGLGLTAQKKTKNPEKIVKVCAGKSSFQVIGVHVVIKKSPPVQRLALWQSRCCQHGTRAP